MSNNSGVSTLLALVLLVGIIFAIILYAFFSSKNGDSAKPTIDIEGASKGEPDIKEEIRAIFTEQGRRFPLFTGDFLDVTVGFSLLSGNDDKNALSAILSKLSELSSKVRSEEEKSFLNSTKQVLLLDMNILDLKQRGSFTSVSAAFSNLDDLNKFCFHYSSESFSHLSELFNKISAASAFISTEKTKHRDFYRNYFENIEKFKVYGEYAHALSSLNNTANEICTLYNEISGNLSLLSKRYQCSSNIKNDLRELREKIYKLRDKIDVLEEHLNNLPKDMPSFFGYRKNSVEKLKISVSLLDVFTSELQQGLLCD